MAARKRPSAFSAFVLSAVALGTVGSMITPASAGICGTATETRLRDLEKTLDLLQKEYDASNGIGNEDAHRLAALDATLLWRRRDLYSIRDDASYYENVFFAVPRDNTESDAFRHFYGTVRLARDFSLEYAERVPMIHDTGLFDLGSLMDKYNNRVAHAFATEHFAEIRSTNEEKGAFAERVLAWSASAPLIAVDPQDICTCERFPAFFAWADRYMAATRAYLQKPNRK